MRKIICIIIAVTPFNFLRILFYRILLGYEVDFKSKIGMFNIINCQKFKAHKIQIRNFNILQIRNFDCKNNVKINKLNRIRFMNNVVLHSNTQIGSSNIITGTRNHFSPYNNVFEFELLDNSILTANHYIDCAGTVKIGSNVVFGGRSSEVWTHGFDTKRIMIVGDVTIGNNVYVGSNSKILQGSSICNNVSIGAGTIVSKSITESGFYVSSQLLRKADFADYSNNTQTVEYEGAKFYHK